MLDCRIARSHSVVAVQISFGPISWLMIGEIFPLSVRGQAIAVCTLTNFGTNFAVSCPPCIKMPACAVALVFVLACVKCRPWRD